MPSPSEPSVFRDDADDGPGAAAPDADGAPPSRVGRYVLLGSIGAGGMGEVFRARAYGAAGAVKELCIKRIRGSRLIQSGATDRFIAEARLSMRLAHGGIVSVFDFGRAGDDGYYLAMEWVDGADLRAIVADARHGERPLDPVEAAHVGAEIASALAYAHGEGVVHRDVKPANVLVSRTGEVKLTDFGVAAAVDGGLPGEAPRTDDQGRRVSVPPAPDHPVGTPAYMAPEQAPGGPGSLRPEASAPPSGAGAAAGVDGVDGRADVYALGVVLGEMLAGSRPRPGEPLAGADLARIPDDLFELLDAMLAPRPERRPGSAAEVADALERFVAAARAAEPGPSPRHRLGERAARVRDALARESAGGTPSSPAGPATELPTQTLAAPPGMDPVQGRPVGQGAGSEAAGAPGSAAPSASGRPARRWLWASFGVLLIAGTLGLALSDWAGPDTGASSATGPGEDAERQPASTPLPEVPGRPPGTDAPASAAAQDGEGVAEEPAPPPAPSADSPADPDRAPDPPARGAKRDAAAASRGGASSPGRGDRRGRRPTANDDLAEDESTDRSAGGDRTGTGDLGTVRRPPPPPPPPELGPPTLNVNAIPWGEVRIDGRALGTTPIFGIEVGPGPHVIEVENPSLGTTRRTRIVVEAGERRDVVLDLR